MDDIPDIISYTEARAKLADLMDKVVDDHAPVTITRQRRKPVVLLSKEDYDSIQETLYLMSSPANAKRLRASIADANAGRYVTPPARRRAAR